MDKVLIIRLSAMGDVAMTVPVLQNLVAQYPEKQFYLLTRKNFFPIFELTVPTLQLLEVDPYLKSGFGGLLRLFFSIRRHKINVIADLHNVLRTQVLKKLFYFTGVKWISIDKNRNGRKELTAKDKIEDKKPLSPVYKLHQTVFEKLGLPIQLDETLLPNNTSKLNTIGFAPGSKHATKNWVTSNNNELIDFVLSHSRTEIFLFGDPKTEKDLLETLSMKSERVKTSFHLSLKEQLELMKSLKVLVCMDSANMHLASAVGTPVISIWCSTSPQAGFLGYGQLNDHCVQVELNCRPCSIYGNKPCWRGDLACTKIPVHTATEKLSEFIS